jgi:hypothetical protein
MGWKYVMLELTSPGGTKIEFPIIFPDKLVHIEVATVMKLVAPLDGNSPRVASAGMIETLVVKHVGGKSDTLRIGSRKIDERTINLYNYEHGIKGL